jgi:hypothetical protein
LQTEATAVAEAEAAGRRKERTALLRLNTSLTRHNASLQSQLAGSSAVVFERDALEREAAGHTEVCSDAKVTANRDVRDFGWEIARGAVTRRPPISLDTVVPRAEGYTYDVGVWDLSIVQEQFPAAPCQTLTSQFASL